MNTKEVSPSGKVVPIGEEVDPLAGDFHGGFGEDPADVASTNKPKVIFPNEDEGD